MNCKNCGANIGTSKFCQQCGKPSHHQASSPAVDPNLAKTRVMPARPRTRMYPADISVCFDTTASMGPYIDEMRDNVIGFSRDLEDNGVDARLALVEYRDLTIGEPIHVSDFTSTPETFRSWVAKLHADGGGPIPESTIDAVDHALDLKYREKATRAAIVITDAPYHEPSQSGLRMDDLIKKVQGSKVVVYVVGPEIPGYIDLANAMQGLFFEITSDPSGFRSTLRSLGKSISETATRGSHVKKAADAALGKTRVW